MSDDDDDGGGARRAYSLAQLQARWDAANLRLATVRDLLEESRLVSPRIGPHLMAQWQGAGFDRLAGLVERLSLERGAAFTKPQLSGAAYTSKKLHGKKVGDARMRLHYLLLDRQREFLEQGQPADAERIDQMRALVDSELANARHKTNLRQHERSARKGASRVAAPTPAAAAAASSSSSSAAAAVAAATLPLEHRRGYDVAHASSSSPYAFGPPTPMTSNRAMELQSPVVSPVYAADDAATSSAAGYNSPLFAPSQPADYNSTWAHEVETPHLFSDVDFLGGMGLSPPAVAPTAAAASYGVPQSGKRGRADDTPPSSQQTSLQAHLFGPDNDASMSQPLAWDQSLAAYQASHPPDVVAAMAVDAAAAIGAHAATLNPAAAAEDDRDPKRPRLVRAHLALIDSSDSESESESDSESDSSSSSVTRWWDVYCANCDDPVGGGGASRTLCCRRCGDRLNASYCSTACMREHASKHARACV